MLISYRCVINGFDLLPNRSCKVRIALLCCELNKKSWKISITIESKQKILPPHKSRTASTNTQKNEFQHYFFMCQPQRRACARATKDLSFWTKKTAEYKKLEKKVEHNANVRVNVSRVKQMPFLISLNETRQNSLTASNWVASLTFVSKLHWAATFSVHSFEYLLSTSANSSRSFSVSMRSRRSYSRSYWLDGKSLLML